MAAKGLDTIDKNFRVETNIKKEDICFHDVEDGVFRICGVFKENGMFRRMPEAAAKEINKGVYGLHTNTAGGRVRFVTNSTYVAIRTEYTPCRMSHFPLTGSSGFDMYTGTGKDARYAGTFVPPVDVENGYESVIDFADDQERLITVNFPLYSDVRKLYIGLQEGASLREAPEYNIKSPVVYYGSSITQGACASKPGSCYPSILSRKFDCDYINLGFSGSAKGEETMGQYLAGLEMSLFVMDYDHNAPNSTRLKETHSRLFRQVRSRNPELPIIIMPRPRYYHRGEDKVRFDVIERTYLDAKAQGDQNVYFISNKKLMELVQDNGSVDNTHPTDSGFLSMSLALEEVFEQILKQP